MLAHLLLVLATQTGMVQVRVPFADMAACEAFMKDPAPLTIMGPAAPLGAQCVDEKTVKVDPGKPI